MIVAIVFDWNNLTLLFLSLVAAFTAWQAKRTAKVVDKTAKVVDQVHVLTNSQRLADLLSVASVSESKAQITEDPQDIEAAKKAKADYFRQVKLQACVDEAIDKTKPTV